MGNLMANGKLAQGLRMELDATPEAILAASHAVRDMATSLGLGSALTTKINRAVCEVLLNSCTYAYRDERGKVVLQISCDDDLLEIEVIDFGRGFNCADYFAPDGSPGPRAQPHMGLTIAARAVDSFRIESSNTGTVVRMVKQVKR